MDGQVEGADVDTTGAPVQIGQAGQNTGQLVGVTVNMVSR